MTKRETAERMRAKVKDKGKDPKLFKGLKSLNITRFIGPGNYRELINIFFHIGGKKTYEFIFMIFTAK